MNQRATIQFLTELRKRVLWSVAVLASLMGVTFYFSNALYDGLALPLINELPVKHLIATNVLSAFFTPFEFAFDVAFFLSIPIFLYHVWAFVSPALYARERRFIWPLLIASVLLFYAGLFFAYFAIFPLLFSFLSHAMPHHVELLPDMSQYLSLAMRLLLMFGFIFQLPILVMACVKIKVEMYQALVRLRPYMIVISFIVGMLIAPPDVLSQTVVAIPLWCLYEIGLFLSRIFIVKNSSSLRAKRSNPAF